MTYYIYHNVWGIGRIREAYSAFRLMTSNRSDWLLIYLLICLCFCVCDNTTKDVKPLSLLSVSNILSKQPSKKIPVYQVTQKFIWLANPMVQSPPWAADETWASQKIPRFLYLQYLTTSPYPDPDESTPRPPLRKSVTPLILKQFVPARVLRTFFRKIHFSVILPHMARHPQCPNLNLTPGIPWEV
jgi:hypothetical protein